MEPSWRTEQRVHRRRCEVEEEPVKPNRRRYSVAAAMLVAIAMVLAIWNVARRIVGR